MTEALPDGVWLDLDPDVYFEQPDRLGSTDLMKLHRFGLGFWWASKHNPFYKRQETAEQTYGSALHAIILEGEAAYESRFAPAPTKPPKAISTIPEMRAALAGAGFTTAGKSAWGASDWQIAMRQNLPRVPVWPNILSDWRRTGLGDRTEITAEEDWILRFMADVVTSPNRRDNADVRKLFAADGGYPALAEVSILWTDPTGQKRRARIDRMFPRFDLDLKSLGNWSGRPLKFATGDIIAKYAYDIQRADYFEARLAAYRLIADGKLYGGSSEQRAWLRRFPNEFEDFDWIWLFFQKPAPSGRAPVLFPIWDDSHEMIGYDRRPSKRRAAGLRKMNKALALYSSAVEEFGLDKPWARVEPLHFTDDTLEPSISFPHWIDEDDPIDEAAYAV